MTTLIVAAVVTAWLFVGVRYTAPSAIARAVRNRIGMWESVRGKYTPEATPAQIAEWRREAVADNILMIALGPLPLLLFALTDWLYQSAPLTDVELKARLRERDRRIAELEKDLKVQRGGRQAGERPGEV